MCVSVLVGMYACSYALVCENMCIYTWRHMLMHVYIYMDLSIGMILCL